MKFRIRYKVIDAVIKEEYIDALDEQVAEEFLIISLDKDDVEIINTEQIEEDEI